MHSTEPSTGGSQRRADRRVLLVEYFLAGDQLMMFGVRADLDEPAVSVHSIDQQELQRFEQANFGGGNRVRDLLDLELDELWHFYDFLVAPVGQWAAPGDIVYLIPHGLLHYLPLHALRIDDLYLAERNPVVYGPSAAVLKYVVGRRARGRRPSRATVFGDSRLNLPSARAEAVALAAALRTEPVLGAQVTRDNFVQRIEGADIVHFAGHAQVHADDVGGAGLQLAGQDVLSATEVLGLPDLDAAIVTLSGCETGVNERAPGDELMGLTRGFLYAGASSVLVSLWEVADESTEVLMRTFYGLLLDNPDMLSVDALQHRDHQTPSRCRGGAATPRHRPDRGGIRGPPGLRRVADPAAVTRLVDRIARSRSGLTAGDGGLVLRGWCVRRRSRGANSAPR